MTQHDHTGEAPAHSPAPPAARRRVGLVVHPARDIDAPLRAVWDWTARHDVEVIQIPVAGQHREVAEPGEADDCELIVSIGGDGTTLAAIRAAVVADRPVLGVACGSLGALTTVAADRVLPALERFAAGDWRPRWLPALEATRANGERIFAINDIVVVRAGQGQVRSTARVDGSLFARLAGDGCIVSTAIGSSAYALAAGGPLLAPGTDAYLLTPLPTHGGACPPLVISADSELQLAFNVGHGGGRVEIDGQIADHDVEPLTIGLRPGVATLVTFADQEPLLTGLRRRQIITDSPRILAEDGGEPLIWAQDPWERPALPGQEGLSAYASATPTTADTPPWPGRSASRCSRDSLRA